MIASNITGHLLIPHQAARAPVTELGDVIKTLKARGAGVIVDFGAGRGRNVKLLAKSFRTVLLVEDEANLIHLSAAVEACKADNCHMYSWRDFKRDTSIRADASLLCCVIHTIPTSQLREEIVKANLNKLKKGGLIVFVTPRGDSKYTETALAEAVEFEDGIVRLRPADRTFSFYRKYNKDQLCAFLSTLRMRIVEILPSNHRVIVVSEYAGPQRRHC